MRVECFAEAGVGQGVDEGWLVIMAVHQIHVVMRARLATDERIDPLTTTKPDVNVRLAKQNQDP